MNRYLFELLINVRFQGRRGEKSVWEAVLLVVRNRDRTVTGTEDGWRVQDDDGVQQQPAERLRTAWRGEWRWGWWRPKWK